MNSTERHEARYQRRKAKRAKHKADVTRKYNQYDTVFSYQNLYHAYLCCRKNVRWKASTQSYIANAPLYVYQTYSSMRDDIYRSGGFFEFDVFERGKKRHIKSVEIRERVVQRCLCDFSLVPMLKRTFIYDNGASMPNKGYSFAIKRFRRHLKRHIRQHGNSGYILLFDFSSFFDNIPHQLLFNIVDKEYTDEKLKEQIKHFIGVFGDKGIGLGSQISQVFALASANALDHFIKEELHINGYGRYMDDGYLIHEDKAYLKYCLERIKEKCKELGLILSERKTMIVPIRREFTWLKINNRVTDTGKIIKKPWHKSIVRMRRKLKKFKRMIETGKTKITPNDVRCSYTSWKSHIKGLHAHETIQYMDALYQRLFSEYFKT